MNSEFPGIPLPNTHTLTLTYTPIVTQFFSHFSLKESLISSPGVCRMTQPQTGDKGGLIASSCWSLGKPCSSPSAQTRTRRKRIPYSSSLNQHSTHPPPRGPQGPGVPAGAAVADSLHLELHPSKVSGGAGTNRRRKLHLK